eukprot:30991-Pelagococcus_subviridis.AAC.11
MHALSASATRITSALSSSSIGTEYSRGPCVTRGGATPTVSIATKPLRPPPSNAAAKYAPGSSGGGTRTVVDCDGSYPPVSPEAAADVGRDARGPSAGRSDAAPARAASSTSSTAPRRLPRSSTGPVRICHVAPIPGCSVFPTTNACDAFDATYVTAQDLSRPVPLSRNSPT